MNGAGGYRTDFQTTTKTNIYPTHPRLSIPLFLAPSALLSPKKKPGKLNVKHCFHHGPIRPRQKITSNRSNAHPSLPRPSTPTARPWPSILAFPRVLFFFQSSALSLGARIPSKQYLQPALQSRSGRYLGYARSPNPTQPSAAHAPHARTAPHRTVAGIPASAQTLIPRTHPHTHVHAHHHHQRHHHRESTLCKLSASHRAPARSQTLSAYCVLVKRRQLGYLGCGGAPLFHVVHVCFLFPFHFFHGALSPTGAWRDGGGTPGTCRGRRWVGVR
jgi:hypothetical protein